EGQGEASGQLRDRVRVGPRARGRATRASRRGVWPHPPRGDARDRGRALLQYGGLGRELHGPGGVRGRKARATLDGVRYPLRRRAACGADVMRALVVGKDAAGASFEYGRIAELYDAWFRVAGFKRGLEQFLERVEWRLPARARVLDAGA